MQLAPVARTGPSLMTAGGLAARGITLTNALIAGGVVGGIILLVRMSDRLATAQASPAARPSAPPVVTPKGGRVVCPAEQGRAPISLRDARPGDFVIVRVATRDLGLIESMWAAISSFSPDRSSIRVKLAGLGYTTSGLIEPSTDEHGFFLGQQFNMPASCVWDWLPMRLPAGVIPICGSWALALGYQLDGSIRQGEKRSVAIGDGAGQGTSWHERIDVEIDSIGATGNSIGVVVLDSPLKHELHGLKAGSKFRVTRDCLLTPKAP